ncbi:MAG TPA: hypothetical protein VMH85_20300 [Terriglobales bacterium]|nr:hypothetical protein [Terriglobales bacterium]
MRIRRRLPIVAGVLLVAGAVALIVFLLKHAPPEPARLLPGADGFIYFNLRGIRRANIGQLPQVSHDPEYEKFIQATGFQFERDLDEAAFAVHYPDPAPGASFGAKAEPRYSEVLVGKIQTDRFRQYLRKISGSVESYGSNDIFSIPLEGRTLRVAILGVDTVAASNVDDPGVIRGIIDRSRKLASPFAGPALLRKYYKRIPIATRYVPFAGLAWAIFRVEPSPAPLDTSPMSLSFLFDKPAVVVASVRAFSGVHLRVEAFTGSDPDAKHVAEQLSSLLTIFRSTEGHAASGGSGKSPDPDLKQFFDSLKVEQNGERAALTATVPVALIHKITQTEPAAPAGTKP